VVSSRVVGAGNSPSPVGPATDRSGPVGMRFKVQSFAEALYQLCACVRDHGVVEHYDEYVTRDMRIEMTHELNARCEELVAAVEGDTKWQDSDVDVVFEAVHAAVARPDSPQANERTVGR